MVLCIGELIVLHNHNHILEVGRGRCSVPWPDVRGERERGDITTHLMRDLDYWSQDMLAFAEECMYEKHVIL